MKEIPVSAAMAGQKLDRLLEKTLKNAGRNFIYRMLRKKNITLNGKKATGHESVREGDVIRIWFSDETLEHFTGKEISDVTQKTSTDDTYPVTDLDILFENKHMLIVNKPAGMLTQKSAPDDISLNEYAIGYLLKSGGIDKETLNHVKPSVCNRLDRNTSGIVCIGKTQTGLRVLGEMFRDRTIHKYYHCVALGHIEEDLTLTSFLKRDEGRNVSEIEDRMMEGARPIETHIHPLRSWQDSFGNDVTLLEVALITGRTHQIRSQLSAIGHPLIGDPKYGDRQINKAYRDRYGLTSQLLHCARIEIPFTEELMTGDGPVSSADDRGQSCVIKIESAIPSGIPWWTPL